MWIVFFWLQKHGMVPFFSTTHGCYFKDLLENSKNSPKSHQKIQLHHFIGDVEANRKQPTGMVKPWDMAGFFFLGGNYLTIKPRFCFWDTLNQRLNWCVLECFCWYVFGIWMDLYKWFWYVWGGCFVPALIDGFFSATQTWQHQCACRMDGEQLV